MTNTLKPCPFCGQSQMHIEHADGVYLTHRCEGRSDRPVIKIVNQTEERAIEAWNRRATRPAMGEAAVKAMVKPLTYGQKLIAEAIEAHFGERDYDYDEDVDDASNHYAWEAFAALSALDVPAQAEGREAQLDFANRLSAWKDEHHDCDCPAHESCGCKELREIIQQMECDALPNLSHPEPVAEEAVEIAHGEDDMPERIWAGDFDGEGFGHCVAGMQGGLYSEYVRADLAHPAPLPEQGDADDLVQRLRGGTMRFDWADLHDDALIPAVPLLREAATALAVLQAKLVADDKYHVGYLAGSAVASACRSRAKSAEAKNTDLQLRLDRAREDSERWRALMSSQRMHFMGCAGIDLVNKPGTTERKTANLIPVMKSGEDQHFGMEFWSKHSAFGNPDYPDDFERSLLTTYVDHLRAARAFMENGNG